MIPSSTSTNTINKQDSDLAGAVNEAARCNARGGGVA
jgi:hypothetical protein